MLAQIQALFTSLGQFITQIPLYVWAIPIGILLISLLVGIFKIAIYYKKNKSNTRLEWINIVYKKWNAILYKTAKWIAPSIKNNYKKLEV